ncbi:MAG: PfkB family carbohydrate kinase, partial [Planctomycetota bacterium]
TNTARTLGCVWPARRQIVAVSWIGQDERRWYAKRLAEISGIRAVLCARPCFTRFACTLLEASGRETHIKERMPPPSRADEAAFLGFWRRLVRRDDIVALCGSAPEGTSSKLLREVYIVARKAGVRALIADSSGAALELAAAAGLDGLKGNAAEIGAWLGLGQALDPAKRVSRRALQDVFARPGAPRAVLCTLGAAGAVLAVPGKLLRAAPPALSGNAAPSCRRDAGAPRQPQSATGCGDAATAGWLWAILQGCALEETLRRAVACGTAKLASPDPGCLDPRYVERLMRKTSIQTVPI